jgi:shikimate kinase
MTEITSEPLTPKPRVFLVGMMGSGKTTVGRRLASTTGWPYLDNDALVHEATGRTGEELMVEQGEAALHDAELAAFERALGEPAPVITGVAGWLVTREDVRARMAAAGTVVWLRARPETLRLRAGGHKGRRAEAALLEWISATLVEREAAFEAVADLVIDVDERRPRDAVARILDVVDTG